MSIINEQFINGQVTEADWIEYDEDFSVVGSNYKKIEEAFRSQRGRRMNHQELEVLETALQTRKVADEALLDEIAVEKCHEHWELMMFQSTLDDGLEAVRAAVEEDVEHALSTKGIYFEYKLSAHPLSDAIITQYAAAAVEVDQRHG
jgi:hypothetical protein